MFNFVKITIFLLMAFSIIIAGGFYEAATLAGKPQHDLSILEKYPRITSGLTEKKSEKDAILADSASYPQMSSSSVLTDDDKIKIRKLMESYEVALAGQSLNIAERYLLDYFKVHLPKEKTEQVQLAISNLIEYKKSLIEIEINSNIKDIPEEGRSKWKEMLRKDVYDKFVLKDGEYLYATESN